MTHNTLETLIKLAPSLVKAFSSDMGIAVTDHEKFLFYSPGDRVDMKIQSGTLIFDDNMKKSISTGEILSQNISKDILGIPFRSTVMPIKDDFGKIIGSLGIARSLDVEIKINTMISQLVDTMHQIAASSEEIASASQDTSERANYMVNETKRANEYISETNKIMEAVQRIANQTKMLGLNASIESARAGEAGKGFSVVAHEVGKLANNSQESVKQVNDILEKLRHSLTTMVNFIEDVCSITQNQASGSEELASSAQQITYVVEELSEVANKL